MNTPFFVGWAGSAAEAARCLGLGLRAALTLQALLFTLSLWLVAGIGWVIALVMWHAPLQRAAEWLMQALLFGGVALASGLGSGRAGEWGEGYLQAAQGLSIAVGWVLLALFYLVAVVVTVRVLAELLLMGRIRRQVLAAYPGPASAPHTRLLSAAAWGLRLRPWLLLALSPLCLLIPLAGPVLFFVLLGYLNARFLVNDATDGLADTGQVRALLRAHRRELLLIGLGAAALSLVPLAGLIVPWATGAAVCHLAARRLAPTPPMPTTSSPH